MVARSRVRSVSLGAGVVRSSEVAPKFCLTCSECLWNDDCVSLLYYKGWDDSESDNEGEEQGVANDITTT